MSDLEDAQDVLMDANASALGSDQFVLLNGLVYKGIIEEIPSNESPISGGQSETEIFRAKLRKRDFSDPPEKGDPAVIRGRELQVVSWLDRNGVEYEVTFGDLTSGER